MEFRLRAGETPPSFPYLFSASSSFGGAGYFTANPDYINTTTLCAAASEIRERECMKAKIREEIIAAEYENIVRKRVLEDEVRRELAIGDFPLRQMALMRFPMQSFERPIVGERRGLMDRSELPFQRRHSVAAAVAEVTSSEATLPVTTMPNPFKARPVVYLEKPSKPNFGNTTEVNANPYLLGPKKVAKEWSCALCQVSATSEEGLNDHLRGKKHKAKKAELSSNEELKSNEATNESQDNAKQLKKLEKMKQKAGGRRNQVVLKKKHTKAMKKRKAPFWCKDCKVGCYSGTVMASHCSGKKHKARVQGLEEDSEVFSATTPI